MIALARKEVVERRVPLAIAFVLVCAIAASVPFFFGFSLKQAALHPANGDAASVLRGFRSYAFFLESTWLARGLGRTMMLLALVTGAGAIAGEREAHTLPLLAQSGISLRVVTAIKFLALSVWLFLVAGSSAGILAANSLVAGRDVPVVGIVVGSFVAWANAVAFLSIVIFASAAATRTAIAAGVALVLGFAIAGTFSVFGVNATALGAAVAGPNGAVDIGAAVRGTAIAVGIATLAGVATIAALDARRV